MLMINQLRAFYFYAKAKHLRKKGCYNALTLKLFLTAWELSKNNHYLIAYINYRRDLGKRLTPSLGKYLIKSWWQLSQKNQVLMSALLLESDYSHLISKDRICHSNASIPAVLAYKDLTQLSRKQQLLLSIYSEQMLWRGLLADVLKLQAQNQGIFVVGNAGIMSGSGLGASIDSAGFVVRFNAFRTGSEFKADLGLQSDAWCVTPSFKPEIFHPISWLLVTGPEVQYRLADWDAFYEFRRKQIPIVTLPLAVWGTLVKELQAPPSAGVSLLAFLHSLLGSWTGISVAGFGALMEANAAYHYMNAQDKAASRHNWEGEKRLLRRWLKEGLTSLHQ